MIDSSGTFIAAYVLVAVIYIGYALSLYVRARRHPEKRSDEGPT